MTKASDNVFPRFLISEGGSTSTPASGRVTVYAKADGLLYSKDDAGTETLMSGGGTFVGARAIWASGDLSGTGSWVAAPLNGTDSYDTDAFHDTSTNNNRMTVPAGLGGYYSLKASYSVTGTGGMYLRLHLNATTVIDVIASGTLDSLAHLATDYNLSAGDYVALEAYAASSVTVVTGSFSIAKIG